MNKDNDSDCNSGVPIDWEVARTLTDGDETLLDELRELFLEESAKHLEAIRVAIEQDDGPSLTRAAHTLKSAARLFGASTLAALALTLERLGQSSQIAEAQARLFDLQKETGRVTDALQQGPNAVTEANKPQQQQGGSSHDKEQ